MKRLYLLLFTPIVLLAGCSKVADCEEPHMNDGAGTRSAVLGEQLENPYSVENMRKAYLAIPVKERPYADSLEVEDLIRTTHRYVKFKITSEEELGILKSDSTLIVYSYPLDYDIISFVEDADSDISEDQPAYYYASVPADRTLTTEIEWEILEELFIPDEYNDVEDADASIVRMGVSGVTLDEPFIETLVGKSMELTGNEEPTGLTLFSSSKWRPAGNITYYDEELGRTIGLEGIKVKARRWFTTHTGIVGESGYYSCNGRFRRPANYSFDLECYDFHIKGGKGVRTDYNGPKKTGNWDYSFRRSTNELEFAGATVFRAAYHYYYKNIRGLRRPPQNSFWRQQMNIKLFDKGGTSNAKLPRRWFSGNPIKLYNIRANTIILYATAIHELAHTAHWRMIVQASGSNRNTDYNFAEDKMCESWARGVEHYLTRMVYPNYRVGPGSNIYTNVVIDLIDTEADHANNDGHDRIHGDNVSGYTMYQIETALIGCDTWNKWKNNIKNKYNNATKDNVDALFASW